MFYIFQVDDIGVRVKDPKYQFLNSLVYNFLLKIFSVCDHGRDCDRGRLHHGYDRGHGLDFALFHEFF